MIERSSVRLAAALMCTFVSGACSGDGPSPTEQQLIDQVKVIVSKTTIPVAGSVDLVAAVEDETGAPLPINQFDVTFFSSNPSIVTVDQNGVATGVKIGSAALGAEVEGLRDSAFVNVSPAAVVVTPPAATLTLGDTMRLTASALDANADPISLTGTTVDWFTDNAAVATISGGLITAKTAGTARMGANIGGVADTTVVTVEDSVASACPAPDIAAHGFDDGTYGGLDQSLAAGFVFDGSVSAKGAMSLRRDWVTQNADAGSSVNALFTPRQKVYARFYWRHSAGFDVSGIQKMIRFRETGFNAILGTMIVLNGRFAWFYDSLKSDQNFFQNVGTEVFPADLRGEFHEFEIMNDISSSGALRLKIWIDGVLHWDHTIAASNQGLQIGIVMFGGTFNEPAANGSTWIDEVAVSSQCIDTTP